MQAHIELVEIQGEIVRVKRLRRTLLLATRWAHAKPGVGQETEAARKMRWCLAVSCALPALLALLSSHLARQGSYTGPPFTEVPIWTVPGPEGRDGGRVGSSLSACSSRRPCCSPGAP